MTICSVYTIIPRGLDGQEITIEVDSNRSLPTIDIIGLPDNSVKESKERLRATFRHCNIEIPPLKYIINLAPSNIRKTGTIFDMAIATALLYRIFNETRKHKDSISSSIFLGELGLNGDIKSIHGILPAVVAGMRRGYKQFFVPEDNKEEVGYIEGIIIYPIKHFQQIIDYFLYGYTLESYRAKEIPDATKNTYDLDFSDIQGHDTIKRSLAIAATGMHNIIMIGPPGTGKTMLAKALRDILPPMSFNDMIDVSQIYSLIGKLSKDIPLIQKRPFRHIHHTASKISIVGGGQKLLPGEISLAHKGILFLDELAEFPRDVLDVLRQPIEDAHITISRSSGSITYPSQSMIVGAMNPCICGYYKDTEKICTCTPLSIKKYQSKISGPLIDRIDMILHIPRQEMNYVHGNFTKLSSHTIREKVLKAWHIQQKRFQGTTISTNSEIPAKSIHTYISLDNESEELMTIAIKKLQLSLRAVHKLLKLTRSIADYEGCDSIQKNHLLEALQYRGKEMFIL